jgi:hypothetical protein
LRAFLLACVAIVVIAIGGYFLLASMQQPTGVAFASDGTRISTNWVWRGTPNARQAGECDPRKPWQWFFVDFGHPSGESALCKISQ